jgi:hypothetical protein
MGDFTLNAHVPQSLTFVGGPMDGKTMALSAPMMEVPVAEYASAQLCNPLDFIPAKLTRIVYSRRTLEVTRNGITVRATVMAPVEAEEKWLKERIERGLNAALSALGAR